MLFFSTMFSLQVVLSPSFCASAASMIENLQMCKEKWASCKDPEMEIVQNIWRLFSLYDFFVYKLHSVSDASIMELHTLSLYSFLWVLKEEGFMILLPLF